MRVSEAGRAFIMRWEGLRLAAYRDVAGVWTIGYGHTQRFRDGRFDDASKISKETADALFDEDLRTPEARVNALVKAPMSQNIFDALVSFEFNTGALHRSTALRRLNKGDVDGAARALQWWCKARIDGRLVEVPGLVRRRAEEAALMLQPV